MFVRLEKYFFLRVWKGAFSLIDRQDGRSGWLTGVGVRTEVLEHKRGRNSKGKMTLASAFTADLANQLYGLANPSFDVGHELLLSSKHEGIQIVPLQGLSGFIWYEMAEEGLSQALGIAAVAL